MPCLVVPAGRASTQCQWNIIFNQEMESSPCFSDSQLWNTAETSSELHREYQNCHSSPPQHLLSSPPCSQHFFPFCAQETQPWSHLSFGFVCRGALSQRWALLSCPECCWTAVSRQRNKCLGKSVFAFAEGFPNPFNSANLTVHAIVATLEFLLAEVQQGAECLGALLSVPFSAALCLTKSTEMLHFSTRPREED